MKALSSNFTNHRLLVALSGGCDSVALLLMLREAGATVEAAHCNFHLRGSESDRDERFCRELCERVGVVFHVAHFDTRAYAELHHLSIETAARNLRYAWFEQLRQDLDLDAIAVAHHMDDQAETVLMHLLRGSGLHGLTGMRPINGHVVRPLLHLTRKQLERYLEAKHQIYVTDSTNLERDAMRNHIRLDVMPLLESIYPHATEAIARCADHLAEAEKVVQKAVAAELSEPSENSEGSEDSEFSEKSKTLSLAVIRAFASPSLLLHEWLTPYGFTPAQTAAIARHLDAQTGTTYQSATHTLVFDRQCLIVAPTPVAVRPLVAPETGTYLLSDGRRLRITQEPCSNTFTPSRNPLIATLDADSVQFPLTLRTVREGDRFRPFGMSGSKLVSDYLTDRHVSILDKRAQLVLTQADGQIIWLPGHRTSEPQRITAQTTTVLRIALEAG